MDGTIPQAGAPEQGERRESYGKISQQDSMHLFRSAVDYKYDVTNCFNHCYFSATTDCNMEL